MRLLNLLRYIVQFLCGALLIYWGYVNLYPIEFFEYRLVEQYIGGWYLAPVIARLVVSIKFLAGLFLILNLNPGNMVPKILLPVVLLHVYDMIWAWLNPNAILTYSYTDIIPGYWWLGLLATLIIGVLTYIMLKKGISRDIRFKWIKYPLGITAVVLPFILNAIFPDNLQDMSTQHNDEFNAAVIGSKEIEKLAEDKVLVGFFSTSCPFCVNAARKIVISQERWSDFPPFFICFVGQEGAAEHFLSFIHRDIPHQAMEWKDFSQLSDGRFPKFAWVEKGVIKKRWDGRTFNYYTLKQMSSGEH